MENRTRPLIPVNPENLDDVASGLLSGIPQGEGEQSKVSFPNNVNVVNPEKYIFLPAKNYSGNQSYTNTLLSLDRLHNGKNWFDAHKLLAAEGAYMPTIRQFVDFVKLLKSGSALNGKGKPIDKAIINSTLDDIFKLGNYGGRWLDADFKVVGNVLNMNYGHRVDGSGLKYKHSEQLISSTLMSDRKPGIDLTDWISRATNQGLPSQDAIQGDIWYYKPLADNNSVARFGADSGGAGLVCNGVPSYTDSSLGVHAARKIGGSK